MQQKHPLGRVASSGFPRLSRDRRRPAAAVATNKRIVPWLPAAIDSHQAGADPGYILP
jgi:hypothetical protein